MIKNKHQGHNFDHELKTNKHKDNCCCRSTMHINIA